MMREERRSPVIKKVGDLAGMQRVSVVSVKNVSESALEVGCVSEDQHPFFFQVGATSDFAKKLICLGIGVRGAVTVDFEYSRAGGTTMRNVVPVLPQKRASS